MLAKRNLNMVGFGPVLSGVVKTIINPMMAKEMDAQTNTFVAIFCPDMVVDPRCSTKSASGHSFNIIYASVFLSHSP